jgi:hypothetical protein
MYRGDGIEARIIATGVGGAFLIAIGPLLVVAVRTEWLLNCLLVLSYAAGAAVVAHIWPQLSWRTGLWFFLFLPPALLASFFFTGTEVPIKWQAELRDLFQYVWGLVGACFGGWLGATISKSRRKKLNTAPPSDGP